MSNKIVPVVDAEMQQVQDDLLQSIREFKAGNFARVTQIEIEIAADSIAVESLKK